MMNTETILARVYNIRELAADSPLVCVKLDELAADLNADIRMQCARSKGVGSAAKVIASVLKAVRKDSSRAALHYAHIDDKGFQCVCDGFRAFRLKDPLPLEPRPADAPKPMDVSSLFPDAADLSREYHTLSLPAADELKAFVRDWRAKHGRKAVPAWDFGQGEPVVSALFLLDLLAVLPDVRELHAANGSKAFFSPLYAFGANGDALVLPLRSAEKTAQRDAAKQAEAAAKAFEESDEGRELARKRRREAHAEKMRAEYADAVHGMLTDYTSRAADCPDYAMTADDFALLAWYSGEAEHYAAKLAELQAPAV